MVYRRNRSAVLHVNILSAHLNDPSFISTTVARNEPPSLLLCLQSFMGIGVFWGVLFFFRLKFNP